MHHFFFLNLAELAEKRAIGLRDEARLWDILARDLKREAGRREESGSPAKRIAPETKRVDQEPGEQHDGKLFVRIADATKMMGIGRSSLYKEISSSKIAVRKCGRKTLIAKSDIQKWFDALPTRD